MSPSDVFTPFGRRFTDEHKRSIEATRALFDTVGRQHQSKIWGKPDAITRTSTALLKLIGEDIELPEYQQFLDALDTSQQEVLTLETQIFGAIELDSPLTLRGQMEINTQLRERQMFFDHEDEVCELLLNAFHETAQILTNALPPPSQSALTVPLVSAIANPAEVIEAVLLTYLKSEHFEARVFNSLNEVLYRNACKVTGVSPETELTKPLIYPTAAKMRPAELVDAYLVGTPLHALFSTPYPFELPAEQRFAGHWIIAPPGRGKTTLLHAMVNDDIKRDAAIILMDSKGDLIAPFRDMKDIEERLVVIDPDPKHPISINPLDIPRTDIGHAIDLLEYLFASLLEFKMTPTQTMLFRSVLRLIVTEIPNPTLEIFRDLLANGTKKYEQYVERLSPDLRDFFRSDYNDDNFRARRREVLQRLRLLLDNETMGAMLLAVRTRFIIDDALDSGKIVIINNSKSRLGEQGAEFFGRFFIAQVLAAAQRRSPRSRADKKPVYFYIDEAHNVIARDERIPTILDECRSQNIALILAHQRSNQIASPNVLSALQNCAIRFANSDEEARSLSHSLRTAPEFLQSLERGRFAAYIRDLTKTAIAIDVDKVDFGKYPKLSATEQAQLRARMQQEYGPQAAPPEPAPPAAPTDRTAAPAAQPSTPDKVTDPGEPSDKW